MKKILNSFMYKLLKSLSNKQRDFLLKTLVFVFIDKGFSKKSFLKKVDIIIFNEKYKYIVNNPSKKLEEYYKKAANGKEDFKKDLLYRQLRKEKTPEYYKLSYRFIRNKK